MFHRKENENESIQSSSDVVDDDAPKNNNSPESASFVRGLTRTVQSFVRRSAVGRLPKHVPVKRVVLMSDRLSTGLDVIDTAASSLGSLESAGSKGNKERRAEALKWWGRRGMRFTAALLKNTILGAAVFETYEAVIVQLVRNRKEKETTEPNPTQQQQQPPLSPGLDPFARASIPTHFLAGACAGSAHSIVSHLMERTALSWRLGTIVFSGGNLVSTTIHHALAHSALFGTFEWTKRRLLFNDTFMSFGFSGTAWKDDFFTEENDGDSLKKEDKPQTLHGKIREEKLPTVGKETEGVVTNKYDLTLSSHSLATDKTVDDDDEGNIHVKSESSLDHVKVSHLLATGTAGGIAGQTQHILSHYTEAWFQVNSEGGVSLRPSGNASISSPSWVLLRAKFRKWFLPAPLLRSVLLAFPPSALGFIAFEYGKNLIS